MPVSASATRSGTAATAAGARGNADGNNVHREAQTDRAKMQRNHQVNLAFRKKVASLAQESAAKEKVVNKFTHHVGASQRTVQIVENVETGERGLVEYWGEIKNIPRALRMKRNIDDMLDVDDEVDDDVDTGGPEGAEVWDRNETAARRKKKATPSSAAKRQKKAASSGRRSGASTAPRNAPENNNAPVTNDEADTPSAGTRRSARVASGIANSGSSRTPRPSTSRREPIIREDEEENHVTVHDDADDGSHSINEYHFRRSTRAASDDLNSLSERLNHFEIKSEAGSESTRVFSRESSLAEPLASSSRL